MDINNVSVVLFFLFLWVKNFFPFTWTKPLITSFSYIWIAGTTTQTILHMQLE